MLYKVAREYMLHYFQMSNNWTDNLISVETMEIRTHWNIVFKVLKENKQLKIL